MLDRERVVIEVDLELVWTSGSRYGTARRGIVKVIKIHKDNSFRVEGAGLKPPHNRFIGRKGLNWGDDAGKIVGTWFHAYGQTPGSCCALQEGDSQEKFDAELAKAEAAKKAKQDERQAAIDAQFAAVREANKDLMEQTKAPLDFDDMHTIQMVDRRGNRMRVIYKVLPKRIHLWSPEFKEVDGVELRATIYGASTMGGSWRRDDVEDVTEAAALLDLAYKLW
jgi:hypothetical protein